MESDILQPLPRGEGPAHNGEGPVHYVDDGEFVRLVLSRRKLERVGKRGHAGDRIRDVWTGEVYELVPRSGDRSRRARTLARSSVAGAGPSRRASSQRLPGVAGAVLSHWQKTG